MGRQFDMICEEHLQLNCSTICAIAQEPPHFIDMIGRVEVRGSRIVGDETS